MKRKNILFLTTQLPYPPISGGTIKSFHYIRHLGYRGNLHLACLLKNNDDQNEGALQQKVTIASYFSLKHEVERNGLNLLKSYLISSSFNSFRNKSEQFKTQVREMSKSMDAIIVDHYEMFQYIPKNYDGKIVFHSHNAEFMLWERMASLEKNIIKKALLYAESFRVKKLERKIIEKSDVVYATPNDISVYKKSGIESLNFATTYHLGNDKMLDLPNLEFRKSEKAIMFIGTLSWEPNIHGVLWFIQSVLPELKKAHPDIVIYIIGGKIDKRLLHYSQYENLVFTGFVDDVEEYYKKARLSFVPLQFGSGMKVKVLEAMYRGIPLVSTSVGAEGIEISNAEDAFIEDDPVAFAGKISSLLQDEKLWKKFNMNSREIAREKYTWAKLFQQMDKVLDKVLN